jgi:transcriptional regulator with XRE-family HTH domain
MRTNLKLFRIKHNLTQAEFAEKLGCTASLYSVIEVGKRNGSMTFWQNLQQAFNVEDSKMWELTKVEQKQESDGQVD